MKVVLFTFIVSLLSIANGVLAETQKEKAEKYASLSGIDETITAVPAQFEAIQNQLLLTEKDPVAVKKAVEIFSDQWNSASLRNTAIDYIAERLTVEQLDQLIKRQETPLVRKMVAEELMSTSPSFQSDFMQYVAELHVTPPQPDTIKAIQQFVSRTKLDEVMLEMSVQVTGAVLKGFGEIKPESEAAQKQAEQQITAMRVAMKPMMEQQAVLMSYYIYRNIANEDLDEYSAFYETELGQIERDIAVQAFTEVITEWLNNSIPELKALTDAG